MLGGERIGDWEVYFALTKLFGADSDRHFSYFWVYLAQPLRHSS